ncbi:MULTISPECIES: glycosyltransferase [Croceibacter]|uniref:glycosyltransferase n=1 Tax=Croceibacter TaxID=216431 RepID=UPI000C3EF07C|nr:MULTISPECIES: glycosyltransferase [Croceibacter]MBG26536.1 glycosyltransferase [Croceibacter sp.]
MKHLLVIGKTWPEPQSTGAGWRMIQLLKLFKSFNYEITFGSASAKTEFSEDLSEMNITETQLKMNDSSFNEFLKQLDPNIVLFDRFMVEEQFGWRVSETCPNAIKILDTEDLHCLRAGRQQAFSEQRRFKKQDLLNQTAKREIASILRCDLSIMISEVEINILKQVFQIDESILHYIPFLLDPVSEEEKETLPTFEDREGFVMLGNLLHPPNFESVKFVKKHVWPIIKKEMPEAQIHIYGAYTSQKVQQFHNKKEGFLIMGRAESASDVLKNARVLLSPLLYGAGLKTKFINAMQNGTPNITTIVGAEGIGGLLPFAGEIANDPKVIAKEAVKHYNSRNQWKTAQKNGFKIIEERFSKSSFEGLFQKKLNYLETNLTEHRNQNFLGQVLQHHQSQSTKYMSKWIEEKNKS